MGISDDLIHNFVRGGKKVLKLVPKRPPPKKSLIDRLFSDSAPKGHSGDGVHGMGGALMSTNHNLISNFEASTHLTARNDENALFRKALTSLLTFGSFRTIFEQFAILIAAMKNVATSIADT